MHDDQNVMCYKGKTNILQRFYFLNDKLERGAISTSMTSMTYADINYELYCVTVFIHIKSCCFIPICDYYFSISVDCDYYFSILVND